MNILCIKKKIEVCDYEICDSHILKILLVTFYLFICSDRILTCRIKSICSPAKGGTGCYRFNYQPGS